MEPAGGLGGTLKTGVASEVRLPVCCGWIAKIGSSFVEQAMDRLKNDYLLAAAEQGGYELLLTTDKNLRY